MPQGVLTTSPLSRARLPASHLPPPSVRSRQEDVSLSEQARTQFARLDVDPQDPMIGWLDGCPDDVIIWGAMLNSGTGSLPDALVLKLPAESKRLCA